MKNGTMYYRVIPADRKRGYVILFSWERPVIQRLSEQMSTLGAVTRESLTKVINTAQKSFSAAAMVDTTDLGIQKKLAKMFGEDVKPAKVEE